MAKASLKINDKFNFKWNKITVGSVEQKREIPVFVNHFFEKNITTRYELLGEEFHDKYITKYYEGDIRVKKWSPGVKEVSYKANPQNDPLFLIEFEFIFRGNDGGIQYNPNFTKDSNLKVELLKVVDNNESETVYSFQIIGELIWDYKASDYKKHIEKVEEGGICCWDEMSIDLRINFRDNYEVKRVFQFDEKGYKLPIQPLEKKDGKTIGNPEDKTNTCFILDIMPNVYTIISNKESSMWPILKSKNIHMSSKYLNF